MPFYEQKNYLHPELIQCFENVTSRPAVRNVRRHLVAVVTVAATAAVVNLKFFF